MFVAIVTIPAIYAVKHVLHLEKGARIFATLPEHEANINI